MLLSSLPCLCTLRLFPCHLAISSHLHLCSLAIILSPFLAFHLPYPTLRPLMCLLLSTFLLRIPSCLLPFPILPSTINCYSQPPARPPDPLVHPLPRRPTIWPSRTLIPSLCSRPLLRKSQSPRLALAFMFPLCILNHALLSLPTVPSVAS